MYENVKLQIIKESTMQHRRHLKISTINPNLLVTLQISKAAVAKPLNLAVVHFMAWEIHFSL